MSHKDGEMVRRGADEEHSQPSDAEARACMVTVGKGLGLVILLAICGVFAYVTRRGTASREELDLNPFHPGTAAHAQWSLRRPDRLLARREAARYFPKDATAAAAYAVASHLGQLGLRRLTQLPRRGEGFGAFRAAAEETGIEGARLACRIVRVSQCSD